MSQPNPERAELERLGAELATYAGRLVRAVSRRAAHAVPAASLRLLSQIDELGPVSIGRLARADRCSQPTMSAAVAALAEKGWLAKRVNPADARSSLVALTGEGRAVLAEARRGNGALVAERLRRAPRHDERDLATAVALLRALLDIPDEPDDEPEGTS